MAGVSLYTNVTGVPASAWAFRYSLNSASVLKPWRRMTRVLPGSAVVLVLTVYSPASEDSVPASGL